MQDRQKVWLGVAVLVIVIVAIDEVAGRGVFLAALRDHFGGAALAYGLMAALVVWVVRKVANYIRRDVQDK